jgi:hypothetical protein
VPIVLKSDTLVVKMPDISKRTRGSSHSFTLVQLPLVPYHATTFHKAQGVSCDKVCLWQVPTSGDSLMLYVGLSRVRTLAGLYMREPLTAAAARRAAPSIDLLKEIARLDQLQPVELRTPLEVLEQQIAAVAALHPPKAKRVMSASTSAKRARTTEPPQ